MNSVRFGIWGGNITMKADNICTDGNVPPKNPTPAVRIQKTPYGESQPLPILRC